MAEVKMPDVVVEDPVLRARSFWQKYQKPVIIAFAAIVVAIAGWLIYKNWVVEPKEEKARESVFKAQQYFAKDSLNLALNGDGVNKGFLYIINNYGGTKTANLAKYYVGVSYLKLGNYNNAVKYLKDFSTDAKQIQMMAYGCLGDAYSELKKNNDAIDAYKKAASAFEKDDINSSEYLYRAALLSEVSGKNKEALELYKELKDKYPATEKGAQADKYIYRLSIEPNDLSVK
jgi:tetratricopeptide (TPR) repeat protein